MKKKNQVERYHVQYISEIETEKKKSKGQVYKHRETRRVRIQQKSKGGIAGTCE